MRTGTVDGGPFHGKFLADCQFPRAIFGIVVLPPLLLPPLLALGFLSPWMLWGVSLGAIPLVIHLLHRQRYRETTWAAMRFLTAAIRKQSQRMRLEQWLLLAVRTAILLLIALALAGPLVNSLTAFVSPSGTPPTHRILVLDASLSMGLNDQGRSRFEQAREIARDLLQSSRQGDTWNLVRISGTSPAVIIRRPSSQPDAVLKELEALVPLEEVGGVSATWKEVDQLLRGASGLPRKEIYLLTDLQAVNWRPADATSLGQLRQSLKLLPEGTVHVFPVGSSETANAAVTSLQLTEGLPVARTPVSVRVGLTRYGSGNAAHSLELRVDDRLQETRAVTIPLGGETSIDWSPSLSPGEHRLEVRLNDDELQADNRRGAVVTVRDRLPILLVNGKPSGQPWENATDLLKLALAPDTSGPFAVTVIPESELLSTPLTPFACVLLCNLALITDREAGWLTDYLTQGGAVVICAGGQVRLDQYNQVLLAPDRPLLPAKLVELVGDPASTESAFEFDPGDFSHPIIKPFQGNPNSGLELTKTFAYLRTEIPPDRETQVALRFSNGDPAILTSAYGPGRVVLVTTSVDREWGMWAVWGHSFIPLMHEIVRYATADRLPGRQLLIGETLTGISESDSVRQAVVTIPNGEQVSLVVSDRQIAFDQTVSSGFYKLEWGSPASRSVYSAVNINPLESDPAAITEQQLKAEFPESVSWKFHGDSRALPQSTAAASDHAAVRFPVAPWSRWLLLTAFWLLLAEQGLAWRFPVGVIVLCVGVLIFVVQLLAASTTSSLEFALKLGGLAALAVLPMLWQRRGTKFQ